MFCAPLHQIFISNIPVHQVTAGKKSEVTNSQEAEGSGVPRVPERAETGCRGDARLKRAKMTFS